MNTTKQLKMTRKITAISQKVEAAERRLRLARELTSISGMFGYSLSATARDAKHSAHNFQAQLQEYQSLSQAESHAGNGDEFTSSANELSLCLAECGAQLEKLSKLAEPHKQMAHKAIALLTADYHTHLTELVSAIGIKPEKLALVKGNTPTLAEFIARAVSENHSTVPSADGGTFIVIANRKLSNREIRLLVEHAEIKEETLLALPDASGETKRFYMSGQGLFGFITLSKLDCVLNFHTRHWSA